MLGSPRVRRQGPRAGVGRRWTPCSHPRTVAVVGASDDSAKWGHIIAQRALAVARATARCCWSTDARRRGARAAGVPVRPGGGRSHGRDRRPGRRLRPGGRLRGLGDRRRRRRGPGDRGHHRGPVRGGRRGRPTRGRGARDRPRRGRRAGRSQLPGDRRHHDRAPAGPRRPARRATWPCSARAATSCSTWPGCWPTAGWACRGSSRSATRPTSGSSTSCAPASATTAPGPSPSTPRTSSTVAAFLDAARALRDAGKPLVLLAPGRTEAAVRSAASHTGSLTSSSMVVDAACAAVGARRVDHPTQMADLLVALRARGGCAGRRVAILTDGGGHGAVAADALAARRAADPGAGRRGRPPSSRRRCGRRRRSPTRSTWPAPASRTSRATPAAVATLLGLRPGRRRAADRLLRRLLDRAVQPHRARAGRGPADGRRGRGAGQAARRADHLPGQPGQPGCCAPSGIPVHRDVDRACTVLAGLVEPATAGLAEELPPPAPPVSDTSYAAARALFEGLRRRLPGRGLGDRRGRAGGRARGSGWASRSCSRRPDGCTSPRAAEWWSASPTAHEVRAAYADLVARLAPPAVSVEAMADRRRRCRADRRQRARPEVRPGRHGRARRGLHRGARRHRLRDRPGVGATPPASSCSSLRGAPLLLGARGRPPVDLDALADVVARVSQLAAAHPELVELELNPVLAGPAGVLALDARVVLG